MAKLSSVANKKPIALDIEGVYVRNLPAKIVDDKFGRINLDLEDDQQAVIVSLFTDLICDADGNNFEDCETFESITSSLSVMDIQAIVEAIPQAIAPSANRGK
tara:strand:- start:307 stop:615 length:309 start_codon:yes stop_codon:yes gene_type:complete